MVNLNLGERRRKLIHPQTFSSTLNRHVSGRNGDSLRGDRENKWAVSFHFLSTAGGLRRLINLETRGESWKGIATRDRSSAREWIKRPIRNCSRRMHTQRPLRGVCVVPRFITTALARLVSSRNALMWSMAEPGNDPLNWSDTAVGQLQPICIAKFRGMPLCRAPDETIKREREKGKTR